MAKSGDDGDSGCGCGCLVIILLAVFYSFVSDGWKKHDADIKSQSERIEELGLHS